MCLTRELCVKPKDPAGITASDMEKYITNLMFLYV